MPIKIKPLTLKERLSELEPDWTVIGGLYSAQEDIGYALQTQNGRIVAQTCVSYEKAIPYVWFPECGASAEILLRVAKVFEGTCETLMFDAADPRWSKVKTALDTWLKTQDNQ